MEDDYLMVHDSKGKTVFVIESDGSVKYTVDGKLKTARNSKDISVAMVGVIVTLIGEGKIIDSSTNFNKKAVIILLKRALKHLEK